MDYCENTSLVSAGGGITHWIKPQVLIGAESLLPPVTSVGTLDHSAALRNLA